MIRIWFQYPENGVPVLVSWDPESWRVRVAVEDDATEHHPQADVDLALVGVQAALPRKCESERELVDAIVALGVPRRDL